MPRAPVISRSADVILLIVLLIIGGYCASVVTSSRAQVWLAWAGLMPLIVAVRSLSAAGAAASGALWGLSLFFFSIAGPGPDMASTDANFLPLLTAPAIYAYLMGRYRRRFGFSPLALALAMVVMELALKGLGIGRGLLSVGPEDSPALKIIADFLGYGFIAFVVAYTDAILLSITWQVCLQSSFCDSNILKGAAARLAPPVFIYPAFSFYLKPSHPRAPPELIMAAL